MPFQNSIMHQASHFVASKTIYGAEKEWIFDRHLDDFISEGNYSFISSLDGDPIYKTYRNFTINQGHTITTTNRCKGLFLTILGDCIINGTLSMSSRGCVSVGKFIGIDYRRNKIFFNDTNIFINKIPYILKDGGNPGTSAGANGQISQGGISCGGGCIDIYHKGIIENNGTIRANGGARVYGGGAGGAGSIRITKF